MVRAQTVIRVCLSNLKKLLKRKRRALPAQDPLNREDLKRTESITCTPRLHRCSQTLFAKPVRGDASSAHASINGSPV